MRCSASGWQWFRPAVTLALIAACNLLLLGALWVADLDFALLGAELYDPQAGPCLRTAWMEVTGVSGPVRVCTTWLDTTDPTGQAHSMPAGEPLAMGADGNLYYPNAGKADRRLLGLLLFAGVVVALGMRVKRRLLAWHDIRRCGPGTDGGSGGGE